MINGISKLAPTLNHFIWGLTLELLRVTDLFIDQWELRQKGPAVKSPSQPPKKICGDSIPVLKPSAGLEAKDGKKGKDVTQVDVLQLPKLHKVLTTLLPTTKIILLKVPFSATWRQTIASTIQWIPEQYCVSVVITSIFSTVQKTNCLLFVTDISYYYLLFLSKISRFSKRTILFYIRNFTFVSLFLCLSLTKRFLYKHFWTHLLRMVGERSWKAVFYVGVVSKI